MKVVITIKGGTYKGKRSNLNKEKRERILRHIDNALSQLQYSYVLSITRRVFAR
ncbi:unnamed protein product, partial [marine sediment metagenome]